MPPISLLYPPQSQIISGEGAGSDLQLIDSSRTLSACVLWSLLENYYMRQKSNAWNDVPSYATNNRIIGETYAELVVALLLDMLPHLDTAAPIYVIEPAAGSGCFAAHFLEALISKCAYFEKLSALNLKYVLTDFSDMNFKNWESQPRLKPWVASGLLHFAVFRPEQDQEITLAANGQILSQKTLVNPIVVIANYFFDSIRHDLFMTRDKVLHEVQLTFFRELKPGLTEDSPLALAHLRSFETVTPVQQPYYAQPQLNSILEGYRETLADTPFLFPIGAMECVINLQQLSGGKLALLSSDKGFTRVSEFANHLTYLPHGDAFSFFVNYHAIQEYFRLVGGESLQTEQSKLITSLNILMPAMPIQLEHTRSVFHEKLIKQNVLLNHCHSLYVNTPDIDPASQFNAFLAHLAQSRHEPMALFLLSVKLMEILPILGEWHRAPLNQALDNIRGNLFTVSHQPDLWATVGAFYYQAGNPAACLEMMAASCQQYGSSPASLYYQAVSQEGLGLTQEALLAFQALLKAQPDCPYSQRGVQRLESQAPKPSEPIAGGYYFQQIIQKSNAFIHQA
jgi:hypothetical protein